MRTAVIASIAASLVGAVAAFAKSDTDRLHYFAVNGGGVLSSAKADQPVNPASVVKVGTTLWALDELHADHRYLT